MPSSVSRTSSSRLLLALIVGVSFATSAAAQPAWISTDVGATSDVGIAGSAVETTGVWAIEGAGRDVWGSADAFHFLYHPVEGWYRDQIERGKSEINQHAIIQFWRPANNLPT